ncbi:MAG: cytochrome C [Deltaproteobacteria bacterium]|nr:cytochrome C [Deltaproteobacteria bacterium]
MLIGVVFLWIYAQPASAQEDEITAGGRFQYQSHCAVCHGVHGRGDGRLTKELLRKPANLTQLAKKNGGRFPFWEVYRVIDGREDVVAHGVRDMPIWGVWFRATEGNELTATGRILELVYYLKSLQEK